VLGHVALAAIGVSTLLAAAPGLFRAIQVPGRSISSGWDRRHAGSIAAR
jgi:hypothetical protein